jgi:2-iminobutanoate/2-iminopropanoate deaminase
MAAEPAFARCVLPSRTLPAPRFRYSPVLRAGPFVFVSGMVALDAQTGALVDGGTYAQTERILGNLGRLIEEMGWTREHVVLARIFCTDFSAFADVNRAWEAFFDGVVPPARTSVGVSALPLGALIEIEFQLLDSRSAA